MVALLFRHNLMQQTSWNLRKLKRELRNCEAEDFMNLFIDFRHQFIGHNGRSATSLFIVNIITERTSQLAGFSIAAHILKIHC